MCDMLAPSLVAPPNVLESGRGKLHVHNKINSRRLSGIGHEERDVPLFVLFLVRARVLVLRTLTAH